MPSSNEDIEAIINEYTYNYEIQYKIGKSSKWASVTKNKSTVTVKGLKSKKRYFVRIRPVYKYNGNYYFGSWSNTMSIRTN